MGIGAGMRRGVTLLGAATVLTQCQHSGGGARRFRLGLGFGLQEGNVRIRHVAVLR